VSNAVGVSNAAVTGYVTEVNRAVAGRISFQRPETILTAAPRPRISFQDHETKWEEHPMGRPPIGKRAMTATERTHRFRAKRRAAEPETKRNETRAATDAAVARLEARVDELLADLGHERALRETTHHMYLAALDAHPGVWTRKQYNVILFCLHPDQRDGQSRERRDAAFRLVAHDPWARLLVKRAERVAPAAPTRPTGEEMDAMRRQARARRRAARSPAARPRSIGGRGAR
jgi:hypothetical protein